MTEAAQRAARRWGTGETLPTREPDLQTSLWLSRDREHVEWLATHAPELDTPDDPEAAPAAMLDAWWMFARESECAHVRPDIAIVVAGGHHTRLVARDVIAAGSNRVARALWLLRQWRRVSVWWLRLVWRTLMAP